MATQVHKVTLLIVDHDQLGPDGVKTELENTKFANHCMSPDVMAIETQEVKWSDEHPLNRRDTQQEAFEALFEDV